MATGTNLFTSHEARILAHTPNNTSTFLRGDNTWTNTLEGNFIINNTSGGDCYIEILRQNNADWRILNSGGNLYFQNNWTTEKGAYFNVLQLDLNTGHAYFKGNITASNGYLISTLNSNTVTIGSQNSSFCHIYNSASIPFIFNNTIACAGTLNDTTASLGTTAYPFHRLVLGGTTDATMTAASTNPRITFQEGTGAQPVHLIYTDYDTYRGPAGLKVVGGTDATPAWFEVEGSLYLGAPTATGTGIYWNPYVESTTDASDVGSIYQIKSGVAGGTELRINQQNDATDCINICTNAYIYLNSKKAFTINDAWLRINEDTGFSSGVYFGTSTVRTDGDLWSDSVRLVDNWIGFYNAVQGATRYGYIQANANRMYFRKENGANNSIGFDFGHNIYCSNEYISGTSNGLRIKNVMLRNDGSNFYFLVGTSNTPGDNWNSLRPFYWNLSNGYCYHTRAYNAVWNDYAEFRKGNTIEPGYCVIETSSGIMTKSTSRLQPGAKMISDTYGEAMGETKDAKTPIAVSGRMLAYTYRNRNEYPLGAAVCSAPGGTIDIMTREEIMMYPERIVGTVSEIPDYDIWNSGGSVELGPSEEIKVNGRIWIYVR